MFRFRYDPRKAGSWRDVDFEVACGAHPIGDLVGRHQEPGEIDDFAALFVPASMMWMTDGIHD